MPELINTIEIQSKVWLTAEEAAIYVGISRRQIDILRIKGTGVGTLPYCKIKGNIRIKRTDIDQFFMRHQVKSAV